MAKTLNFVVKGAGPFPVEMLRTNRCYPASRENALIIADTLKHGPFRAETRTVNMLSQHRPHKGRWQAFGWRVV